MIDFSSRMTELFPFYLWTIRLFAPSPRRNLLQPQDDKFRFSALYLHIAGAKSRPFSAKLVNDPLYDVAFVNRGPHLAVGFTCFEKFLTAWRSIAVGDLLCNDGVGPAGRLQPLWQLMNRR